MNFGIGSSVTRVKCIACRHGIEIARFVASGQRLGNRALQHGDAVGRLLDEPRTMPKVARVSIVNVSYRSTNYWVVSAGTSRLLVDLGYPGTMGAMRASLDRM